MLIFSAPNVGIWVPIEESCSKVGAKGLAHAPGADVCPEVKTEPRTIKPTCVHGAAEPGEADVDVGGVHESQRISIFRSFSRMRNCPQLSNPSQEKRNGCQIQWENGKKCLR